MLSLSDCLLHTRTYKDNHTGGWTNSPSGANHSVKNNNIT